MRTMAILIEYPLLAALVGAIIWALGRWQRRRIAAAAGIMWLLYAAYETGMRLRWLCSGECNIRVDILVIYPALLALCALAVAHSLMGQAATRDFPATPP